MKNKLSDLNNHLFTQLERLNDEDLTGDALVQETQRAKAIVSVAKEIVGGGRLLLDAQKAVNDGDIPKSLPLLLRE